MKFNLQTFPEYSYATKIKAWKEGYEKELRDTSEEEVERIKGLAKESMKTILLKTKGERSAFLAGFCIGHSKRTEEILGDKGATG